MNIFLSYTRNKDTFQKVSQFRERFELEVNLRAPSSRVFQDKQHLSDGAHFPEAIAQELNKADVFLALVSPAWLQSEWCRKEFSLFTDDAINNARLHKILPLLWVDTPELSPRSLDLVARTLANINYSDWRDLRYESWEDPRSQKQIGTLAEGAVKLGASPVPTARPVDASDDSAGRLPEDKERLLLALNGARDGLGEDQVARLAAVSPTKTSVYLAELQSLGFVRQRLRVGQRINHWLVSTPGQAYLVEHQLVA